MREYILGMITAATLVAIFLAGLSLEYPTWFVVSIIALVAGIAAIAIVGRVK